MRIPLALSLALLAFPLPLAAQVIWVDPTTPAGAAVAALSLFDTLLAEQARLRTTPMVHRKVGIRPEKGQEVTVRPGEVIVALLPFRARYIARPTADFINTRGMPVRSTTFQAVRMVNNQFCIASGTKCFNDKDLDGDWDGAGQVNGRWVDVPYEVLEVREPVETAQRNLILTESDLKHREYFEGSLVKTEDCGGKADQRYECGVFVVEVLERQADGAVRFPRGAAIGLTGESKTEAVRRSLVERRARLTLRGEGGGPLRAPPSPSGAGYLAGGPAGGAGGSGARQGRAGGNSRLRPRGRVILDTSAVIAIIRQGPGFEDLVRAIAAAPITAIGAPTLAEAAIVLTARFGADARGLLATLLRDFEIEVVPFGEAHWQEALTAFHRFGKGRHPAALNFGDCLSYATAQVANQPLLALGDDFPRTDLALAGR